MFNKGGVVVIIIIIKKMMMMCGGVGEYTYHLIVLQVQIHILRKNT